MGNIEVITKWLKKQLVDSGTKGYVLGLSGGLDSAVCAGLIKKANAGILALILPIESDPADIANAMDLARELGITCEHIDLMPTYNNILKLLPDSSPMVLGNLKARLRMIVLYYYANLNNYLVCGTGNKTELQLGYFTKYGDGASDVLPLGDLYKYQVREIARTMGIPDKIIKKVPSAGLWPGQTDEGEIGFSYEEIDGTLQDINACRAAGKCAQKLQEMIALSDHKRNPPKICKIPDPNINRRK